MLQLGGHLGGIRHYRDDEAVNIAHYRSLADSLRMFVENPPVAAPGERFSYSSYGFNLLGAAVETAGAHLSHVRRRDGGARGRSA